MHLLIPFASALSDASTHVLHDLHLPNLTRVLARLTPAVTDTGDEYTLSPPHERALAAAWQWHGSDGSLPFAAHAAALDGVVVGKQAWGLVTPAHWHVGRDHVTLADPEALQLTEAESRAAFEAVRELFESEGFALVWGAPSRWYVAHESLAGLPCAALDRVIGRNVDLWIRHGTAYPSQARQVRRLQSEVQLLLYPHALNEEREQRDALTLNSFWLSGCGRAQAVPTNDVVVNDTLRAPLLAQDWVAWADAWRALDSSALATLLAGAQAGRTTRLTLCGERSAQSFDNTERSLWQQLGSRFKSPAPHTILEAL
jgi:hypothetical protein